HMFDHMPSNLIEMGDPPSDLASYEAQAAAMFPNEGKSFRKQFIEEARARREAQRRGQKQHPGTIA
ncbi:MAG: hypothetical protein WBP54_10285, partial [Pelodictyon phaeoclathratiforme]